ncbi:MAG: CDP-glycerol glycerophosphotransferase family protein [Oscillospiraceae bacterium]|jgi:CDP-glycerol glycerophosphotransferase (TagB/SpsB family)|nr:CDP-glycerol glycerophosphotransferase family protein [Oscillospiraceae bacterium]
MTDRIKEINEKHSDFYTRAYLLEELTGEKAVVKDTAVYIADNLLMPLSSTELKLFCVKEYNNIITIRGFYHSICEDFAPVLVYNNQIFNANIHISENDFYRPKYAEKNTAVLKIFEFVFKFEIDDTIRISLKTASGRIVSPKLTHTNFSPFSAIKRFKIPFHTCENTVFTVTPKNNILFVEKSNFEVIKHYTMCNAVNMNTIEDTKLFLYYLEHYKEYEGRKIWLFSDRKNTADDNGWALYNYAKKQNDGIEKYFIINKTGYDKLKKENPEDENIVCTENFDTFMLIAFAEKWASSLTKTILFSSGTPAIQFLYVYDRSKFIFLQHGITKDDVTDFYNERRYNPEMFVATAKKEFDYITNSSAFGYPEGVVKLTGFPRFDNRVYNEPPEKIITFAPTWRYSISGMTETEFKASDYYKMLIDFLTDPILLKTLEKNNFKIILKLHPLAKQFGRFFADISECITIGDNLSYAELFKKSAMLITDFSSVFFDFAYSERPVIYYQKLPNHHKPTYFNYEKDGFGEIITEKEELIKAIAEFTENSKNNIFPKQKKKYLDRINDFFGNIDNNNCKRTYDAIFEL